MLFSLHCSLITFYNIIIWKTFIILLIRLNYYNFLLFYKEIFMAIPLKKGYKFRVEHVTKPASNYMPSFDIYEKYYGIGYLVKGTYRTKCVDRNRLQPLNFKGWGRFNLFWNNFEGGQNGLIKTPASLANKGKNKV